MKAKVTKAEGWDIFVEGRTVHYALGAVIEDELASLAIADGAATGISLTSTKKAPKNKSTRPPETKVK